jgi:ABC-2 type transport system permease protein
MSLKKILFIFKREVQTFFTSPIAYIVISIFLLLTGWFFFSTFFLSGRTDMRDFFNLLPIVFSFIIPAITMRLFAEEYRSGSFEIAGTLPLGLMDIISGKFLAALFFSSLGDLDPGPVIGGYIGAVLLAGAYSAIGVLASSLTRNQIIAFIVSASVCFFLTIISSILVFFPPYITGFFQYLSSGFHFNNIAKGVLDSRDLIYFISIMIFGLYGTFMVIKERN